MSTGATIKNFSLKFDKSIPLPTFQAKEILKVDYLVQKTKTQNEEKLKN